MFNKFPHILAKNGNTEIPQNFIFFDTETSDFKITNTIKELKLKLGWCVYFNRKENETEWKSFKEIPTFWKFVLDTCYHKVLYTKEKSIILVSHNLSFDFRVMHGFSELQKYGYYIEKFINNGTTNFWKFKNYNYDFSIICLDNMNYFKQSLENLGYSVGIHKLIMPTNDDIKLSLYCKRDTEIILETWKQYLKFIETNDLGNFQYTIPSQAISSFRHRFMKNEIFIHTNSMATNLERKSYCGGRTEAYFIGKTPPGFKYLLDVSSMYPSVMFDKKYPIELINNKYTFRANINKGNGIIAYVKIHTTEPVFPYHTEKNKLIFPIGTFNTFLTTEEIKYAMQKHAILKVYKFYVYKMEKIFVDYVKYFYEKRKEFERKNNLAFAYMCKIFLNSLYGKFAQQNDVYTITKNLNPQYKEMIMSQQDGQIEISNLENNTLSKFRKFGKEIFEFKGKQEAFNSFTAISSHITANARMKLWNYFLIAGRDNIYYTDTDSIWCNSTGYENLKPYIKKGLGFLELKTKDKKLIIHGAKDYETSTDVVIKGIKKNAQKTEIENIFKQTKFEGIKGAMDKKHINQVFIEEITKKLNRIYDKGNLLDDGRVIPIVINTLI